MSTDLICTSYNTGSLAASDHFPVEASVDLGKHSILQPMLKRALNKVDMTDVMEKASKIELDTRRISPQISSSINGRPLSMSFSMTLHH